MVVLSLELLGPFVIQPLITNTRLTYASYMGASVGSEARMLGVNPASVT